MLDKLDTEAHEQYTRLAEYDEADYSNQQLVRHLQAELAKLQFQLAREKVSTTKVLEQLQQKQDALGSEQSQVWRKLATVKTVNDPT